MILLGINFIIIVFLCTLVKWTLFINLLISFKLLNIVRLEINN